MKSRDTLIQLTRFQAEEKQRTVAAIETMINELMVKENDLEGQINDEQTRAGISDVSHCAYPMYAKAARDRRNNMLRTINELHGRLGYAQDELAQAFEELKKAEALEENRQRHVRKQTEKREQAALDRAGLGVYQGGSPL